eukprot:Gb_34624 [translate_table: standard]
MAYSAIVCSPVSNRRFASPSSLHSCKAYSSPILHSLAGSILSVKSESYGQRLYCFNTWSFSDNGRHSNDSVIVPLTQNIGARRDLAKRFQSTRCCISTEEILTVAPAIKIVDKELIVHGKRLLSGVPDNIVLTYAPESAYADGAFVGANFSDSNNRHVVSLGTLKDARFLSCFRFKIWWMAQKMGSCGNEIPLETQFLLLEINDESPCLAPGMEQPIYIVFLPILEGSFRACLQGNHKDELELCLESGDPAVTTASLTHSLFIKAGTDPFKVVTDAVRAVELHMQTFHHREGKKMPGILDWFGWCTWDAFYQDVDAEGVEEVDTYGFRGPGQCKNWKRLLTTDFIFSLSEGGAPPRFVIIDDGWQSVEKPEEAAEKELLSRLIHIKENKKFQKDVKEDERPEDLAQGIQHIVQIAKEKYHLKYVYVWHALTGYWGGVEPGISEMERYESTLQYPASPPDSLAYMPEIDSLSVQGLGLVDPKKVFQFYNELHSYLASAGVDGVKVDVQSVLETVGAGFGGRVALASQYHRALDASVARNFPDNGCIACMSHSTDALYFSKQTAIVRASDDFYPKDPLSHTIHIASVSYNSVFLGEFMQPDWDMFHSLHPAAEYHAAARAIGGCPIYVSDKPGKHNFDLLKKLVLPDGSVLRARLPGRPTRDCLFADPNRDGKSLLKIWNMNEYTGVLGVFNCQGAAWSQEDKKNVFHDTNPPMISGSIRPKDVHLLADAAADYWDGYCAVYSHKGKLVRLPEGAALPVALKVLEYEVFTVTPIKNLAPDVSFAPLGLIDMFNAGGAIRSLEYEVHNQAKETENSHASENGAPVPTAAVKMTVHGCGRFGAYSSGKPTKCLVDSSSTDFSFDSASGLLTLMLQKPLEGQLWNLTIQL